MDHLETASRELLARVDTERSRPAATPGTTLAGGIAKVGAKLEALLRALLVEVAEAESTPPETLLPMIGGRRVPLRRATGGQLVHALSDLFSRGRETRRTRAFINDLRRPQSRIRTVIRVRNEVAHEATVPVESTTALADLRSLLIEHRRDAGWP